MLITKFDLYKSEWLDLVFDHRNKEYGAYELRQHYGSNMVKSMGITFAGIGVLIIASIVFKPKPGEIFQVIPVELHPQVLPPVIPLKRIDPVKPVKPVEPVKPVAPQQTIKYTTPVVVSTTPTEEPPIIKNIEGAIGATNVKGPVTGENVLKSDPGAGGGSGVGVDDNKTYTPGTVDVMPEPVGGAAAWGKFLQKNLRYPAAAQEEGISGKVILSFIIERDGSLSNIQVERPAGHGFDEEALRVLKLAKAWSPGKQNGQAVRVKYSIPITFQLANNE